MPAPLGNKNALGCTTSGSPPKYDLSKEAADLLEWSLLPDSTSLYAFTDKKPYWAEQLCQFAKQSVEFSSALRKAKDRIALRREIAANKSTISSVVYNKTIHIYDRLAKAEHAAELDEAMERELIKFAKQEQIRADAESNKKVCPGQPGIDQFLKQSNDVVDEPEPQASPLDQASNEAL